MMKRVWITILILLCAYSANAADSVSDSKASKKGRVFMSATFHDMKTIFLGGGPALYVSHVREGAKSNKLLSRDHFSFLTQSFMHTRKSDFGNVYGIVVDKEMPAGDYEIAKMDLSINPAYTHKFYRPSGDKLRFKVTEGRVTYLGNLNLKLDPEDAVGGTEHRMVANYSFEDWFARDVIVFLDKYPNIRQEDIIRQIIK